MAGPIIEQTLDKKWTDISKRLSHEFQIKKNFAILGNCKVLTRWFCDQRVRRVAALLLLHSPGYPVG
jgi:hypothetical protein